MVIDALIARYGLVAIFAGAGIEGEAVVITGGVLAHRGLMPIWGVAIAAAAGSCLIDQLWFFTGRYFRSRRFVRRTMTKPAFTRAAHFLERHPIAFIVSFRFLYGLRTVSPIAIGASRVPARLFVPLNMLAAAIWGPTMAWLGYSFGTTIDPMLDHRGGGTLLLLAIVAFGAVALAVWRMMRARMTKAS